MTAEAMRRWRANNPDKAREAYKRHNSSEAGKAARKRFAQSAERKAKQAEYARDYHERMKGDPVYLAKRKARQKLNDAIKLGKMLRPSACSECGREGRVEAHHHDYGLPYDVQWLCRRCHVATDS